MLLGNAPTKQRANFKLVFLETTFCRTIYLIPDTLLNRLPWCLVNINKKKYNAANDDQFFFTARHFLITIK